ncbi:MAG: type II secretion system protein [Planctomycetota bacterium]|jgi:prepilin-type N-terminal cleavage/methylation domain-containing protein
MHRGTARQPLRTATSSEAVSGTAGFTLLELLVVIAIISLLAVALLPNITQAMWSSEETETKARMNELALAVESFERKFGLYPPDDFKSILPDRLPVQAKPDGINAGIESMVIFLSWKNFGGVTLESHEDWFANTDGDDNEVVIPLLDRSSKVEVVDAWGTPFAYFHNRNYSKVQTMVGIGDDALGGDSMRVRAFKNPNSSGYLNPRKFQLISAGKDRIFGTEDDLVYPPPPTGS